MTELDPWEIADGSVDPWEVDAPKAPSPTETIAAIRQDPEFEPDPAALKKAYDERFKTSFSSALDGLKGLGQQLFVDLPTKFVQQEQAKAAQEGLPSFLINLPRRAVATGAEGLLQGSAQAGELLRAPLQAAADEVSAMITSPGDETLRHQMFLERVRSQGQDQAALAPYYEGEKAFVPGASPAGGALAGNVLDPTILIPGAKAAGVASKAARGAGIAGRAAEVAAEAASKGGLARSAMAATAPVVERAAEGAGKVASAAATGIDKVQAVADVAGLVTGGLQGAAMAHAGGRAASMTLKWASKARDLGTGLRNIAAADWKSAQPIYAQIAKDADAPVWLRRASSSAVAPLVESTLRGAGAIGKGAAEGGAIGALAAANDTLTPEERGSAIVQGAAMGAAGATAGHVFGGKNRAEVAQAHDIAVRMHKAIQSGTDPGVVLGAPDAVMFYADNVEKLFRGVMPGGKDLSVDLLDAAQFKAGGHPDGAVAAFVADAQGPRIVVNLESAGSDARLIHEAVGHGLMESVLANQPALLQGLREAVSRSGDPQVLLQSASEDYARALLPQGTPEDVALYIQQKRQESAAKAGDPDAWILGEIGAETAVRAVGGRSILDLGSPGFLGRVARMIEGRLPGLASRMETAEVGRVKPVFGTSERTFFGPDTQKVLDDQSLQSDIVSRLRDVGSFRPGLDDGAERGVPLQPGNIGKVPQATMHDLGGGKKGTDFVVATPTGQTVARPPSQVRRLVRNRRQAVNAAVPEKGVPAPANDTDPLVKLRTSISGMLERSGTKLGDWFYTSNVFSETTKALARTLEDAIQAGKAVSGWYHQIGKSSPDWRKSVERDYGNIEAQFKDFVPVNFLITKVGNLIVRNYSLTSFARKAAEWSARKGPISLELWNGDVGQFTADVKTYLKNHADGRPGADGIGEQKRDVINAFLVGGNRTFEAKNPLRGSLRGADAQGLVRSYRLDRLEPLEPSKVEGFSRPSYEKQVRNLSPAIPESPEFKEWFAGSKVVNDDGTPRVVYHSNTYEPLGGLTVFDKSKQAFGKAGFGFYFSDSDGANRFSEYGAKFQMPHSFDGRPNAPKTIPVFLRMRNPLVVDHVDDLKPFLDANQKFGVARGFLGNLSPQTKTRIERAGYDGIITTETVARKTTRAGLKIAERDDPKAASFPVYVVFDPSQIKSATGNRGTFDPHDPDIRHSPEVPQDADALPPVPDEHDMAVQRAARATIDAANVKVAAEETEVIRKAAEATIPEGGGARAKLIRDTIRRVRETKANYPVSEGWAPLQVKKITYGKNRKGELIPEITYDTEPYTFHQNPRTGKDDKETHPARIRTIARRIVTAVDEVVNRHKSGDRAASVMVRQLGWYKNMASRLTAETGGFSDLFADLLGAFSPNTDVPSNWKYAVEGLRKFTAGQYDSLLADFETYLGKSGTPDTWRKEEKPMIVRDNGKLYGMNSINGMKAMADLWRLIEAGQAPKARNFALNLVRQSLAATIDVWAARFLQRMSGGKRIPVPAEAGVQGTTVADPSVYKTAGGAFGFGQEAMGVAAEKLREKYPDLMGDLEPPDLQALVWFLEKEHWAKNDWTTKAGEGGSFEAEADKTGMSRYLAGVSQERPEFKPSAADQDNLSRPLNARIAMMPGVLATRVKDTVGYFMGTKERSFDLELVADKQFDPKGLLDEVVRIGRDKNQDAVFISRVLGMNDENPNARPGLEVYFKDKRSFDAAKQVLEKIVSEGLDGLTMMVDPRTKTQDNPDAFIGARFQYIPEFSGDGPDWQSRAVEVRKTIAKAIQEIRKLDGVSRVAPVQYDTVVKTRETYEQVLAGSVGGAGEDGWAERARRAGSPAAAGSSRGPEVSGNAVPGGRPEAQGQPTEEGAK